MKYFFVSYFFNKPSGSGFGNTAFSATRYPSSGEATHEISQAAGIAAEDIIILNMQAWSKVQYESWVNPDINLAKS